jgi:catechol 2,3-dioxygenase-like lactoylglutathione lyase family enzyme
MTWRSVGLVVATALVTVVLIPQARAQGGMQGMEGMHEMHGMGGMENMQGMMMTPLEVRHIHIRVNDVERTKAFYRDKLGFKVTNETPTVVEFPGLWFGKWNGQGTLVPQGITIGIVAKSVDAAYQMLKMHGVDIPKPPAEAHGAWAFTFKDPDGYEVEVEGPK